jgi:hypothetical protein
MDNDKATKAQENRLRRMAGRQGYTLTKSRSRDPRARDFGVYWLDDNDDNTRASLASGITLEEVETWLTASADNRELIVWDNGWIYLVINHGEGEGWEIHTETYTSRKRGRVAQVDDVAAKIGVRRTGFLQYSPDDRDPNLQFAPIKRFSPSPGQVTR